MDSFWNVLPVVIEIVLPALTLLVVWVCRKFAKKLDLQNTEQLDVVVECVVRRAVDAVEQLAQTAKKQGEAAMTSNNKLARAIDLTLEELKALGVTELAKTALTARIEACLQTKKIFECAESSSLDFEPAGDN